ncbi:hypothetical protein Tco_0530324 [Tanacetum coccineum]
MVIRTDKRHPSNDLALFRLHGLKGHSTLNSLGPSVQRLHSILDESITLSDDLRSSVQRLSSTIWISLLLLLASIECDIVNSTQHHIDSSISREITPATFAQPTLLRTFWENNLNDSALALVWHQQFIKKYGDNVPWDMYEKEALKRFGTVFEDPRVELKNLKQDGTVQQYQELFEALLNRLELSEACVVSLFIGGLKQEISVPIRMFECSGQLHCLEVVLDEEIKVFEDDLPNVVDEQLGLSMTVGEITYVIDLMVLPLGACDMVLGIQWLATLGIIQCYTELFDRLCWPYGVMQLERTTLTEKHEIDIVLDEFKEVFTMPTSFPPKRSHDHHIPLMPTLL